MYNSTALSAPLFEYFLVFPESNEGFLVLFCFPVQIAAMRDVSATETAIIYGLEPLWGAGFAWFLLGERWGIGGWIGAALVLGKHSLMDLSTQTVHSL